jgi:hypothetical protein
MVLTWSKATAPGSAQLMLRCTRLCIVLVQLVGEIESPSGVDRGVSW